MSRTQVLSSSGSALISLSSATAQDNQLATTSDTASTTFVTTKTRETSVSSSLFSSNFPSGTGLPLSGSNNSYIWSYSASGSSATSEIAQTATMATLRSTSTYTKRTTKTVTLTSTHYSATSTSSQTSAASSSIVRSSTAISSATSSPSHSSITTTLSFTVSSSTISSTVALSASTSSAAPTQPAYHAPIASQSSSEEIGLGTVSRNKAGIIAGSITGSLAGLAFILLLFILLVRRRRNAKSLEPTSPIQHFDDKDHIFPPVRGLGITTPVTSHTTNPNFSRPWVPPPQRKGANIPAGTATRAEQSRRSFPTSTSTSRSVSQIFPIRPESSISSRQDLEDPRPNVDTWGRPITPDPDPRSLHPSLLPPPLRVMNPDSRAGTSASASDMLTPTKKSALGTAIQKMKRTFSGDTAVPDPRIIRPTPARECLVGGGASLRPTTPPPRGLGTPLYMRSSVILAGGDHNPTITTTSSAFPTAAKDVHEDDKAGLLQWSGFFGPPTTPSPVRLRGHDDDDNDVAGFLRSEAPTPESAYGVPPTAEALHVRHVPMFTSLAPGGHHRYGGHGYDGHTFDGHDNNDGYDDDEDEPRTPSPQQSPLPTGLQIGRLPPPVSRVVHQRDPRLSHVADVEEGRMSYGKGGSSDKDVRVERDESDRGVRRDRDERDGKSERSSGGPFDLATGILKGRNEDRDGSGRERDGDRGRERERGRREETPNWRRIDVYEGT